MKETELERWDRGKTLLIESLFKPDSKLRGCAYNQNCYDEMMALRDSVIEYVKSIPNPHTPPVEFGKKNNHVEPTITTPNGEISETLMSGALENYYDNEIGEC